MGFTQCHFFAGIGGWSLALRLAGWPDDRSIWTGSCPCQPYSSAGKGKGFIDERHLWPAWFHLIEQCGPGEIFGEQVASKDALAWLDLVCSDLEGSGYAVAPLDICAPSIGAPHIRQRLWFVAHTSGSGSGGGLCGDGKTGERGIIAADHSSIHELGHTLGARLEGLSEHGGRAQGWPEQAGPIASAGVSCGMADADKDDTGQRGKTGSEKETRIQRGIITNGCGLLSTERPGPVNGLWRAADWLLCRDGKWRPVEPGAFPLAHGVPARMGRLRAYGNAIVPEVAAEFIMAYMSGRGLILRR